MVARHKGLTFSRKVAVEFLLTENPSGIINGITSAYTYNPIVSVVFLFQVVNTLRGKALLFVPSPLNIYAETRTVNMCLDLCFTTDFFCHSCSILSVYSGKHDLPSLRSSYFQMLIHV